jgi:hypothetical protein
MDSISQFQNLAFLNHSFSFILSHLLWLFAINIQNEITMLHPLIIYASWYSFPQWINKYLLRAYHVLDIVLGTKATDWTRELRKSHTNKYKIPESYLTTNNEFWKVNEEKVSFTIAQEKNKMLKNKLNKAG